MTKRTRKLRAAVVGAGLMGQWHARELTRLGYTLAAVIDISARQAQGVADRHEGAQVFTTLKDAFANDKFDVIHVCTPTHSHEDLILQSLKGGACVLVEKPMTADLATTRKLLAEAASRNLKLQPVHQFLFQDGVVDAQKNLPRLKGLVHADFLACSAGAENFSEADRERVALEILPHPLGLLARFISEDIEDYEWKVLRTGSGEMKCFASVKGAAISISISMHGRPTTNQLRLIGFDGTIHMDLFHGFSVTERGNVSRMRKVLHPFALSSATLLNAGHNLARRQIEKEPAYPGLRNLIRTFYASIEGRRPVPLSDAEILFVAASRDILISKISQA